MADPAGSEMNGFGHADYATSPSAVQAEFERRACAIHQDFSALEAHAPAGPSDVEGAQAQRFRLDDAKATNATDVRDKAAATAASFRDQAAGAASEARAAVQVLTKEAGSRLLDLAREQKAAGADKLASLARAVDTAAADLDQSSPELARLVRTAAAGAERLAGDVRSRDLDALLGLVADLGRRRPLAFFGGAVLAGFALARFLKADAPKPPAPLPYSPRGDI